MPTPAQIKALQIIEAHTIRSPTQFARLMWPDAEAWSNTSKCGPHGSSRGGGMRMAGGAYLGKLRKAKLIDWWYGRGTERTFSLTEMGRTALLRANLASADAKSE